LGSYLAQPRLAKPANASVFLGKVLREDYGKRSYTPASHTVELSSFWGSECEESRRQKGDHVKWVPKWLLALTLSLVGA
jgi:hypothetical protein